MDLPRMTNHSNHIAVKYYWFRSQVNIDWTVVSIASVNQLADWFTKGLTQPEFGRLRYAIMGWWCWGNQCLLLLRTKREYQFERESEDMICHRIETKGKKVEIMIFCVQIRQKRGSVWFVSKTMNMNERTSKQGISGI